MWSFVRAESYKAVYLDINVELCACIFFLVTLMLMHVSFKKMCL